MTKIISSLFATLVVLASAPAFANETAITADGPLHTCHIVGEVKGNSIAIIIGGQYIRGPGRIYCTNTKSGKTVYYPVWLKLTGFGVGLDLSRIKSMKVASANIGINDPGLFGRSFSIGATTGATLINAGVEFDVAIRVSARDGFGFELGLQSREVVGLGAHLYAMKFGISGRKE